MLKRINCFAICLLFLFGITLMSLPSKNLFYVENASAVENNINQTDIADEYKLNDLDESETNPPTSTPSETNPLIAPSETEETDILNDAETKTITLVFDESDEEVLTYNVGEELSLTAKDKTGFDFAGWFEDENFTIPFELTTMPNENLIVYAKYNIKTFSILLMTNGGSNYPEYFVNYNETFTKPESPTKQGFIFAGWFADKEMKNLYDFSLPVTSNLVLYAKWTQRSYKINFITNSMSTEATQHYYAEDTISLPVVKKDNFKFLGWFEDENFTTPFTLQVMPNRNLTLYAKWEEKLKISTVFSPQSYDFDSPNTAYNCQEFTTMNGFSVYYFEDGEWTNSVPKNAGSYDIKIVRAEDETFSSFETKIKNGFVINYQEINFTWLIVLLFSFWFLELVAIVFAKKLKRMKVSKAYSIFPIAIGTNSIISNTQFALIITASVLVLISFIYLIYCLVDVHRTVKNDAFLPSNLDNRERFKDELIFQNNNDGDSDYSVKTKTDESFGSKYSASDIEKMVKHDTFKEQTLKKRKFNLEDNSSTNWNKVSENEGSDLMSKAKDIKQIINNKSKRNSKVMFFDDDEKN